MNWQPRWVDLVHLQACCTQLHNLKQYIRVGLSISGFLHLQQNADVAEEVSFTKTPKFNVLMRVLEKLDQSSLTATESKSY